MTLVEPSHLGSCIRLQPKAFWLPKKIDKNGCCYCFDFDAMDEFLSFGGSLSPGRPSRWWLATLVSLHRELFNAALTPRTVSGGRRWPWTCLCRHHARCFERGEKKQTPGAMAGYGSKMSRTPSPFGTIDLTMYFHTELHETVNHTFGSSSTFEPYLCAKNKWLVVSQCFAL